jgi:N6-adenosine-specific RNA methylase IME4
MGPFNVVAADPAWAFGDKLPGKTRGAERQYNVMRWEDICQLQLPPIADDALLFMWRVAAMQEEALAVMHMWGFTLKSELVWVKTKDGVVIEEPVDEDDLAFGMGRYTRHCHEVCLIGTRGKGIQLVKNHSIRSVFFAERQEHSRKPEEFFGVVEKMTGGEGKCVELFARRPRENWVTLGDELGFKMGVKDDESQVGSGDEVRSEPPASGTRDVASEAGGARSDEGAPPGAA